MNVLDVPAVRFGLLRNATSAIWSVPGHEGQGWIKRIQPGPMVPTDKGLQGIRARVVLRVFELTKRHSTRIIRAHQKRIGPIEIVLSYPFDAQIVQSAWYVR